MFSCFILLWVVCKVLHTVFIYILHNTQLFKNWGWKRFFKNRNVLIYKVDKISRVKKQSQHCLKLLFFLMSRSWVTRLAPNWLPVVWKNGPWLHFFLSSVNTFGWTLWAQLLVSSWLGPAVLFHCRLMSMHM